MNIEPREVFDHGIDVLLFRSLRVEIFVAQKKCAFVFAGSLEGDPESSGMAQMK